MSLPALPFHIGDRVRILLSPDVEGQITAYCVRGENYVTYEVIWMHNGAIVTTWVTEESIELAQVKTKPGFGPL